MFLFRLLAVLFLTSYTYADDTPPLTRTEYQRLRQGVSPEAIVSARQILQEVHSRDAKALKPQAIRELESFAKKLNLHVTDLRKSPLREEDPKPAVSEAEAQDLLDSIALEFFELTEDGKASFDTFFQNLSLFPGPMEKMARGLMSPNPSLRWVAANAIAEQRAGELRADRDKFVRILTIVLRDEKKKEERTKKSTANVRQVLAKALGNIATDQPGAITALEDCLQNEVNITVQQEALQSLSRLGKTAKPALASVLDKLKHPKLREQAIPASLSIAGDSKEVREFISLSLAPTEPILSRIFLLRSLEHFPHLVPLYAADINRVAEEKAGDTALLARVTLERPLISVLNEPLLRKRTITGGIDGAIALEEIFRRKTPWEETQIFQSLVTFKEALSSKNGEFAQRAAEIVRSVPNLTGKVRQEAIRALSHQDYRVRLYALALLADEGLDQPQVFEIMLARAVEFPYSSHFEPLGGAGPKEDPVQGIPPDILKILSETTGTVGVDKLRKRFKDGEIRVRLGALYLLGSLGSKSAAAAADIAAALADTNAEISRDAITALVDIGAPSRTWVPAMIHAVVKRGGAGSGLNEKLYDRLGPSVISGLLPLLQDPDDKVQFAALRGIFHFEEEAKRLSPKILEIANNAPGSLMRSYLPDYLLGVGVTPEIEVAFVRFGLKVGAGATTTETGLESVTAKLTPTSLKELLPVFEAQKSPPRWIVRGLMRQPSSTQMRPRIMAIIGKTPEWKNSYLVSLISHEHRLAPDDVEFLMACFRKKEYPIRIGPLLWRQGANLPGQIEALAEILRSDKESAKYLLDAVTASGKEGAYFSEMLRKLILEGHPNAPLAITAFVAIDRESAVKTFVDALESANPNSLWSAVEGLAALGISVGTAQPGILRLAMNQKTSLALRQRAILLLEDTKQLIALLNSGDPTVSRAAVNSLGRLGKSSGAVPGLLIKLQSSKEYDGETVLSLAAIAPELPEVQQAVDAHLVARAPNVGKILPFLAETAPVFPGHRKLARQAVLHAMGTVQVEFLKRILHRPKLGLPFLQECLELSSEEVIHIELLENWADLAKWFNANESDPIKRTALEGFARLGDKASGAASLLTQFLLTTKERASEEGSLAQLAVGALGSLGPIASVPVIEAFKDERHSDIPMANLLLALSAIGTDAKSILPKLTQSGIEKRAPSETAKALGALASSRAEVEMILNRIESDPDTVRAARSRLAGKEELARVGNLFQALKIRESTRDNIMDDLLLKGRLSLEEEQTLVEVIVDGVYGLDWAMQTAQSLRTRPFPIVKYFNPLAERFRDVAMRASGEKEKKLLGGLAALLLRAKSNEAHNFVETIFRNGSLEEKRILIIEAFYSPTFYYHRDAIAEAMEREPTIFDTEMVHTIISSYTRGQETRWSHRVPALLTHKSPFLQYFGAYGLNQLGLYEEAAALRDRLLAEHGTKLAELKTRAVIVH
jgi:HEAT repeat protein